MLSNFDQYAELAQEDILSAIANIADRDIDKVIARGHAWATLALAIAVHELAEAPTGTERGAQTADTRRSTSLRKES